MPSVSRMINVAEKQTSHDQGLSRSLLHLHFAATLDEKGSPQAIRAHMVAKSSEGNVAYPMKNTLVFHCKYARCDWSIYPNSPQIAPSFTRKYVRDQNKREEGGGTE